MVMIKPWEETTIKLKDNIDDPKEFQDVIITWYPIEVKKIITDILEKLESKNIPNFGFIDDEFMMSIICYMIWEDDEKRKKRMIQKLKNPFKPFDIIRTEVKEKEKSKFLDRISGGIRKQSKYIMEIRGEGWDQLNDEEKIRWTIRSLMKYYSDKPDLIRPYDMYKEEIPLYEAYKEVEKEKVVEKAVVIAREKIKKKKKEE